MKHGDDSMYHKRADLGHNDIAEILQHFTPNYDFPVAFLRYLCNVRKRWSGLDLGCPMLEHYNFGGRDYPSTSQQISECAQRCTRIANEKDETGRWTDP